MARPPLSATRTFNVICQCQAPAAGSADGASTRRTAPGSLRQAIHENVMHRRERANSPGSIFPQPIPATVRHRAYYKTSHFTSLKRYHAHRSDIDGRTQPRSRRHELLGRKSRSTEPTPAWQWTSVQSSGNTVCGNPDIQGFGSNADFHQRIEKQLGLWQTNRH